MITIDTADVRKFFQRARPVKSNSLMQVLSFVKLDYKDGKATLTKTNLSASVSHVIGANCSEDLSILLDENILSNLCSRTNSLDLTITKEVEGELQITDGKTKMSFGTAHADLFPSVETSIQGDYVEIPEDIIKSVNVAKSYTVVRDGTPTLFSYVHVVPTAQGCDVFSTNQPCTYLKKFNSPLPQITLSPDACSALSEFTTAQYQKRGNIDLFHDGHTTYGFTRSEWDSPKYRQLTDTIVKSWGFEMDKDDVVKFCELALSSSTSQLPFCDLIAVNDTTIKLSYRDEGKRLSTNAEVPIVRLSSEDIVPFTFNAKYLLPALKALPYKKIKMSPFQDKAYFTYCDEDPGYQGVHMALFNPNPPSND